MRPAKRIRAHGYIPRVVETHTMYTESIYKASLHTATIGPCTRLGGLACAGHRPPWRPGVVSCTPCTSPSLYPPPLPLSPLRFFRQKVLSLSPLSPPIEGRGVQGVQLTTGRVLRGLWPAHPNPPRRVQAVHDLSPRFITRYLDTHIRPVLGCGVVLTDHRPCSQATKEPSNDHPPHTD